MAIDELAESKTFSESTPRLADLVKLLSDAFAPSTDQHIMEVAARTLGHLVLAGGALMADVVEEQVKRGIQWLAAPRQEFSRLAGVLVLRELAEHAPAVFNVHVRSFIEVIWNPLRDPKQHIREAAVEALQACLVLVEKRETRYRVQWYYRLFEETQRGLTRVTSLETVHGSLLALGELLRHTGACGGVEQGMGQRGCCLGSTVGQGWHCLCLEWSRPEPCAGAEGCAALSCSAIALPAGEFMLARYREVCETVLKFRESKEKLILRAVITLLPRLAAFAPERFVKAYLQQATEHLLSVLAVPQERGAGFTAIAEMASSLAAAGVAGRMKAPTDFLRPIAAQIREALLSKGRKVSCPEALECTGTLAVALKQDWQPHVMALLDPMFQTGLSGGRAG